MLNIWFDLNGKYLNIDIPEKKCGYNVCDKLVGDLIQRENDCGIPLSRIIVGKYKLCFIRLHINDNYCLKPLTIRWLFNGWKLCLACRLSNSFPDSWSICYVFIS